MRLPVPSLLFSGLLITACIALSVMHATPRGERALLNRQHLRAPSYAAWALMQPLPSMYTFANRAWITDTLATWSEVVDGPMPSVGYVNHYPTRLATFEGRRRRLTMSGRPRYLYLQSVGRWDTLRTVYVLALENQRARLQTTDVAQDNGR